MNRATLLAQQLLGKTTAFSAKTTNGERVYRVIAGTLQRYSKKGWVDVAVLKPTQEIVIENGIAIIKEKTNGDMCQM